MLKLNLAHAWHDRDYSNIHQSNIENGVAAPNDKDIAIDEVASTEEMYQTNLIWRVIKVKKVSSKTIVQLQTLRRLPLSSITKVRNTKAMYAYTERARACIGHFLSYILLLPVQLDRRSFKSPILAKSVHRFQYEHK